MAGNTNNSRAKPFYLKTATSEVFAIYFPAHTVLPEKKDVLFVPPFADEMNKSRRSVTLLAHALAHRGVGLLIVDLYGTGDSKGEFSDARWEIWQDDIKYAVQWLKQQGNQVLDVIGLRMGTLLAMDCIEKLDATIGNVVLWQPVISGKTMMTQFLRLRTTASGMSDTGKKETVQELRSLLEQGNSIEVAGYELAPELTMALDGMSLSSPTVDSTYSLHWFELVYGTEIPLASKKLLDDWNSQGINVSSQAINADPFWTGQNITVIPELLDCTVQVIEGGGFRG